MSKGYFLVKSGIPEKAFRLQELSLPDLLPGQVVIEVEAFGLNFADVMARNGKYRDAPSLPFVPGYDIVGVVLRVHTPMDQHWVGKRVAGFCRFGGYAQQVITSVDAIVNINEISSAHALSLCTQGVTASFMADMIPSVHRGSYALIHAAAGGVGSLLLQLLHVKGIHTIAKVRSQGKVAALNHVNPTHVIVSDQVNYENKVKDIVGKKGLIASFNAVAGITVKTDLKLLSNGGTLFLFGGAGILHSKFGVFSLLNFVRKTGIYSPIPLMMQSKGIIGVNMLKIADHNPSLLAYHLKLCFERYKNQLLIPIPATIFHHSELHLAHKQLESGNSTGKLVVYWGDLDGERNDLKK